MDFFPEKNIINVGGNALNVAVTVIFCRQWKKDRKPLPLLYPMSVLS